jgi:hypothetical protein
MDREQLSTEQRLARLEARGDTRGALIGGLAVAAFIVYLLLSAGVLKIDLAAAKAAGG